MNKVFLDGTTIYLRGIEEADLTDSYIQWFNDSEVCQYNSHHRYPHSREAMHDYYKNVILSKNNLTLAIIDKATNKHIGNVSLQDIDFINRCAEYAIIIGDKGSWGKGVGKDASRLIIDHGFRALNLHRIYCGTSDDNLGMQKLADYLGFVKEGVARQSMFKNGAYRNSILYGLLADEWKR